VGIFEADAVSRDRNEQRTQNVIARVVFGRTVERADSSARFFLWA